MATHLFVKKHNAIKFAEKMRKDKGLVAVLDARETGKYKYVVYVYRKK